MKFELTNSAMEKFIAGKVDSGDFPTPEAVIEDAIGRMMEADIVLTPDDLKDIQESDEQFERGEFIDFDFFAAEMRKKYCSP